MRIFNAFINVIAMLVVLAVVLVVVGLNGERIMLDLLFIKTKLTLGGSLVLFFCFGVVLGLCLNLFRSKK